MPNATRRLFGGFNNPFIGGNSPFVDQQGSFFTSESSRMLRATRQPDLLSLINGGARFAETQPVNLGTTTAPLSPGQAGVSGQAVPFQGAFAGTLAPVLKQFLEFGGEQGVDPTTTINALLSAILGQLGGGG